MAHQILLKFKTKDEKTKKVGNIFCGIVEEKAILRFDSQEQMNFVFDSLIKSGKKAILSRGMLIQYFKGKNAESIKKIMKKDIQDGIKSSKEIAKRNITILDYTEEYVR